MKITKIMTHILQISTIHFNKCMVNINNCDTYIKLIKNNLKTVYLLEDGIPNSRGRRILLIHHKTNCRLSELKLNVMYLLIFCLTFDHKLSAKLCISLKIVTKCILTTKLI